MVKQISYLCFQSVVFQGKTRFVGLCVRWLWFITYH